MRRLPLLPLLLLSLYAKAQTTLPAATVSMNGIGDIKIGMKKAEVEKLTGQPVKFLKLLRKEDWDRDTIHIVYKDITYQLVFDKDYITPNNNSFIVYEVISSSAQLKTKSGISIGDDKLKIVDTYKDYMIQIMPAYEKDYTTKSKTRSTLWLYGDESGKVIIFYLENGKVTGFSVMYNEGC
jgi:hypothetical protein